MTEYELTRRDALAALAAVGAGAAAVGAVSLDGDDEDQETPLGDHERRTLVAVARTVYPSEVEGIPEFLQTYLEGRASDRPDRAEGIADAVAALDEYTQAWYDQTYVDLDGSQEVLREMGVHLADPDPDPEASEAERVRFYLVNEVLYALYTTPTGAKLVGLENPQGYPGGTDSYRRGPE